MVQGIQAEALYESSTSDEKLRVIDASDDKSVSCDSSPRNKFDKKVDKDKSDSFSSSCNDSDYSRKSIKEEPVHKSFWNRQSEIGESS